MMMLWPTSTISIDDAAAAPHRVYLGLLLLIITTAAASRAVSASSAGFTVLG